MILARRREKGAAEDGWRLPRRRVQAILRGVAGAPRESAVVDQVRAECKARGSFFWKTSPGSYGTPAGMPDLICCYRGLFVGLEVKRPMTASQLRPAQVRMMGSIRSAGGVAEVVRSRQEAAAIFDGIDARLNAALAA